MQLLRKSVNVVNIDRYILWLRKSTNKFNICFNARFTILCANPTDIPEKDLRYCETVVELRPELLEVRLSLNNKTLFCQKIVFIDLYPANKAQNSFALHN